MTIGPRRLNVSTYKSLRAKIALGVALPIFVMLASLSLFHYERERRAIETQMELAAQHTGELVLGGMRHALATNDNSVLAQILANVNDAGEVHRVQIIGPDNRVKADSLGRDARAMRSLDEPGCAGCHAGQSGSPPRTIRLSGPLDLLRIATPIASAPDCAGCHAPVGSHLGVLLVDVSLTDVERRLLNDLRVDLLFAAGIAVLFTLGIYVLIHRLVVRRVAAMRRPLAELAGGDFTARLPVSLHPSDEIDTLADAFNHMAEQLAQHVRLQEERSEVRQRAIVEERERIARELHDGMAQLLGYVKTKAMAIRLQLTNRQFGAAERHLLQLEEAAHELFIDVREAILGLKMAGRSHGDASDFTGALREYAEQFNRLNSIPVELDIDPAFESVSLKAETEVQLLRITQEALTNIRKHAAAQRAVVRLQRYNGTLELTVCDDGVGFAADEAYANGCSHFGLSTMVERAEAIGAEFALDSDPGAGTRVTVRLKVNGNGSHARTGR